MSHRGDQPGPLAGDDVVDADRVEDALQAFAAALRSYRLYEGGSPMLDRFVAAARQQFATLWDSFSELRLQIEEDRILWEDRVVFAAAGAASDLPFLFYKDGVRELTISPGFEAKELSKLLRVLARAPSLHKDQDDLITLLWQEDLSTLRYQVVEWTEGLDLHAGSEGGQPQRIDPEEVRATAAEPQAVSTEDFQETLYLLDEAELRQLREEVRRENERDLWTDVLNALLDRLEDGPAERQVRIIGILGELLPSALATAQFGRAATLLGEVVEVASRPGILAADAVREIRSLFDLLGNVDTVAQLAEILEEMPDRLSDDAVVRLLSYFPPVALSGLIRATERIERPEVRRAFESCVQRLAEMDRERILELLRNEEVDVLPGALRWIGRLELGSATPEVTRFLGHSVVEIRIAAVETLVALRAAAVAGELVPLLEDSNRGVRVAAARGLSSLAFTTSREALEQAISSKRLREADRSEKVAFFEAYGRLAGPDGVPLLNRILNSRGWFGRGEPPETRACAAIALSHIRHPSARDALQSAAADDDPIVRTTVARALRGEAGL